MILKLREISVSKRWNRKLNDNSAVIIRHTLNT